MARIPDVRTVARVIPSGAMPIATYTPQIPQIGEMVSGFIAEESDRRSRGQLAKAEADFRIMKAKQDAAYDRDEEYGTITERYGKEMTTGLGSLATSITDPEVRQLFVDKYRVQVETGKLAMDELAWGKEKDFERAGLQERLDALDRGGLESGDIIGTNEAATALIESAAELDHLTEQERVAQLKGFKDNLAIGRLGTMEPEDRVTALKQPWAKNLPADTRAQLQREAMGAVRENKAVGIVDGYMGKGLDIASGMAEAQSIKDPKLRKMVESRFQYDYGMGQKAEAEQQTELLDKYFSDVATGSLAVTEIQKENPEEWEAMGASVQSSLISAQRSSASATKIPFNVGHHDRLTQLKMQIDRGVEGAALKLRKYVNANIGTMSEAQQKNWSTISLEGVMPDKIEDSLTDQQVIASRLPETADASKKRVLLGYMGDWRAGVIRRTGKEPTDEDRTKAVDRALIEYDTTWAWGGMKPVYEMTPEEATEALSLMQEGNPAAFGTVEQYFKESGIQPTDAQFMEAFDKIKDMPADEAAETIGLTRMPGGGAAIGVTLTPEGEVIAPPTAAAPVAPPVWGPQGAVQQEGVLTTIAEVKSHTPSLYKRTMALFEEVGREPSEAQFMDAFKKVVAEMKP